MRTIAGIALSLALLGAAGPERAAAQTPQAAAANTAQAAARGDDRPRRAPLALPEDFAPAVDVSRAPARAASSGADAATAAGGMHATAAGNGSDATPAAANGTDATPAHTIDLGTTSITGNQELPKVLYIVPWKRSDLGDLAGRPVNTLLDEVLTPVDREVFERHLQYYESLFGTREEE